MKTQKLTVFLAIFILLAGVDAQAKKEEQQVSGTRTASALVRISCDQAILPLNIETLEHLLRSSAVAGKAGREILNLSQDEAAGLLTITQLTSGNAGLPAQYPPAPSEDVKQQLLRTPAMPAMPMPGMSAMPGMPMPGMSPDTKSFDSAIKQAQKTMEKAAQQYEKAMKQYEKAMEQTAKNQWSLSYEPAPEQTFLFQFRVDLPDNAKPAAEEFLTAVANNLQQTLTNMYNTYRTQLISLIEGAEMQRNKTQSEVIDAIGEKPPVGQSQPLEQNPADVKVYKQLEQIVDLSNLAPTVSFSEALEIFKNCVKPPLNIVVLWRDLFDNADIGQTTPINMDPIRSIPLRGALDLLLKSVSGGVTELSYVVRDGVITIATRESLPTDFETIVYDISCYIHSQSDSKNLVKAITDTVDPYSWFDTGGEGTINIYQGTNLIVRQSGKVHQKIQKFLQNVKVEKIYIPEMIVPVEMTADRKQDLLRKKQDLEMEVASLEARSTAIGQQIAGLNKQIASNAEDDSVAKELQDILKMQLEEIQGLQKQGDTDSTQLAEAKEKLARAKIALAERREQKSRTAGSDQLSSLSNRLTEIMLDLADKKAVLNTLKNQLDHAEEELRTATTFDPKVSRLRFAIQSMELADRRLIELKTRIATLQPPVVSVVGAQ